MQKKKAIKLAGFVGALCASGALVGTAVSGTGAYFTSSHDGSLSAHSGHLTLNVGETNLYFNDLTPGINKTNAVGWNLDTTAPASDVWLVFDKDTAAYQAFTGGKHSPLASDGGMGGYGYFSVKSTDVSGGATQGFTSGNLAFADGTNTPNTGAATAGQCHVDADGTGGSSQVVVDKNVTIPWCGVPSAIKLVSNVPAGDNGTISVTFGLDGVKQTAQNQDELPGGLPYHIVATQAGISPTS
jgi:hypothetical protein